MFQIYYFYLKPSVHKARSLTFRGFEGKVLHVPAQLMGILIKGVKQWNSFQ